MRTICCCRCQTKRLAHDTGTTVSCASRKKQSQPPHTPHHAVPSRVGYATAHRAFRLQYCMPTHSPNPRSETGVSPDRWFGNHWPRPHPAPPSFPPTPPKEGNKRANKGQKTSWAAYQFPVDNTAVQPRPTPGATALTARDSPCNRRSEIAVNFSAHVTRVWNAVAWCAAVTDFHGGRRTLPSEFVVRQQEELHPVLHASVPVHARAPLRFEPVARVARASDML